MYCGTTCAVHLARLCFKKAKALNASKLQFVLLACDSLTQISVIDLEQRGPRGMAPDFPGGVHSLGPVV